MLLVRMLTDCMDVSSFSEHALGDQLLVDFLQEQFPEGWPETARLYAGEVALCNDVTPGTEEQVAALVEADGVYYVVVYPGTLVAILIIAVAALVLLTVAMLLLAPKVPKGDSPSANNSLGQRVNKARPTERIEDIYGQVISIPTMLGVPLQVYVDNLAQELCYMAIGRGSFDITEVKDGDTPLAQIAGASAEFYGPNSTPNGGTPVLSIGDPVGLPLMDVTRVNEVNGQTLIAPDANGIAGDGDIRFVYPDTINTNNSARDFSAYFAPGDQLVVSGSSFGGVPGQTKVTQDARFTYAGQVQFNTFNPSTVFAVGQQLTIENASYAADNTSGGVTSVNLSGTYTITAVSSTQVTLDTPSGVNTDWNLLNQYTGSVTAYRSTDFTIPVVTAGYDVDGTYTILTVTTGAITLASPSSVNAAWLNINGLPGHATDYVSPTLHTEGEHWAGPYVVDMPTCSQVVLNFVSPQGMYWLNQKGKEYPNSVTMQIGVSPCDVNGTATGPEVLYASTVNGDGTDKDQKATTLYAAVPTPTGSPAGTSSRASVRVRRVSGHDLSTKSTPVDTVQWQDLFGTNPITDVSFGDITTIHTRTYATASATSVKERKLNCRVTRRLPVRNVDNTFGPDLAPTQNAADIICAMALDPFVGGRSLAELDVPQIYSTVEEVQDYFGLPAAGQFNYTYDQSNISFEEMITAVATSAFCVAYRQGSKLRLFFEKKTPDSALLFNHRNKLPGSETRTVRFGYLNDNDGIELDYVSSVDGAKLTVYVPADQSAVKPKKLDTVGIQDDSVAFLQAARAFNKIKYQNTQTQFDAHGEATQLIQNQRVEVTDNTRPDVFDGYIKDVIGNVLELSQPFVPVAGHSYTIFVQRADGLEAIDILAGADKWHVVLQTAPETPIVVNEDATADTTYQITGDDGKRSSAFLVTTKGTYDKSSLNLQLINYDDRYYADDLTYRELVDANGPLLDDNGALYGDNA